MSTKRKDREKKAPAVVARSGALDVSIMILLVLTVVGLVLFQGGFHATETAAAGLVVALLCIVVGIARYRNPAVGGPFDKPVLIQAAVLVILVLWYAVSVLRNSPSVSSCSKSLPWAIALALFLLVSALSPRSRRQMLGWFSVAGVVLAYVGLLVFSRALLVNGALNAERLQFTFQYANAAGVFFLIVSVLCLSSSQPVVRAAWIVPFLAVIETQSIAAIALGLACVVALCFPPAKARDFISVNLVFLGLFGSFCLYVCAKMLPDNLGLIVVLLVSLLWFGLYSLDKKTRSAETALPHSDKKGKTGRKPPKTKSSQQSPLSSVFSSGRFTIFCVLLFVVAVCVFSALNMDRIVQASQTGIERLIQIIDAAALAVSHPLFGVGPGNWQYFYAEVQSAQYATTVVHCSFMKIAVEAGLLALVAFVAFCGVGIWRQVVALQSREQGADAARYARGVLVATVAFLIHCLIDFDLEFSALLFLMIMLLSFGGDASGGKQEIAAVSTRGKIAALVSVLVGVLCLCFSVMVLYGQSLLGQLENDANDGNADAVRQAMEEHPLLASDVDAQDYCLMAFANAGDYASVIEMCEERENTTAAQRFDLAEALYKTGQSSAAEELLLSLCQNYPYQIDVFERTRRIAAIYDNGFLTSAGYKAAVDRANELAYAGHGAWLNNQKDVGTGE